MFSYVHVMVTELYRNRVWCEGSLGHIQSWHEGSKGINAFSEQIGAQLMPRSGNHCSEGHVFTLKIDLCPYGVLKRPTEIDRKRKQKFSRLH